MHTSDLGTPQCTSSGGLIEIPQSPGVHVRDIKWTKVSNPDTNSDSPVGVPQHGTRNITSVLHVLLRDPTVGLNYINRSIFLYFAKICKPYKII